MFQNGELFVWWMRRSHPNKSSLTLNIEKLCESLPHGSGLDGKCEFQPENSNPEKLVFFFEFHHMNENGYYDGWTEHNLTITPSLQFGYNMRITGRNKGNVKEYLHDLFENIFE